LICIGDIWRCAASNYFPAQVRVQGTPLELNADGTSVVRRLPQKIADCVSAPRSIT
jgi:hypothetical protein